MAYLKGVLDAVDGRQPRLMALSVRVQFWRIEYKQYNNGVSVTFVGTAALREISAMAEANRVCSKAIYN